MRSASHSGTRPPCSGRSALPDLWAMRGPETRSDRPRLLSVRASLTSATRMRIKVVAKDDGSLAHRARQSAHPSPRPEPLLRKQEARRTLRSEGIVDAISGRGGLAVESEKEADMRGLDWSRLRRGSQALSRYQGARMDRFELLADAQAVRSASAQQSLTHRRRPRRWRSRRRARCGSDRAPSLSTVSCAGVRCAHRRCVRRPRPSAPTPGRAAALARTPAPGFSSRYSSSRKSVGPRRMSRSPRRTRRVSRSRSRSPTYSRSAIRSGRLRRSSACTRAINSITENGLTT